MRALKVTARLCSPLAGDAPMLDSLLESCMLRRMPSVLASSGGHKHHTTLRPVRGGAVSTPSRIPIPIDRKWLGEWFVPCASSPIMSTVRSDGVERIARKFPTELAAALAPGERIVINSTGGDHKSYLLPLRVRLVQRVVWFCLGRGDSNGRSGNGNSPGKEIRKLLNQVHGIGDEVKIGYGRVAEWTVEPAGEDWSWFAPSDAGPVLMRPLPAGDWLPRGLVGSRPYYGACVGPYWQRENFTDLVYPA